MREIIRLDGIQIGEIDHNKHIFVTERTEAHKFHIFEDGFGLSDVVLDALLEKGVEYIVVIFEKKDYYWARYWDFVFKSGKFEDNGDLQSILPLKKWNEGVIPIMNEVQIPLSV